ncbi:MAG: DUF3987 domain-containing protein [Nitrospinae bacterium]|nr:DUF3987 domain-containing protein [Nitrospinota bacterium]
MLDAISLFRKAIRSAGLEPPEAINADGILRRFASNGKRGDDAGWYVLHGDDIAAGAFGDWRTGISQTWRANIGRTLTPAEELAYKAKVDAMRREREIEETKRRGEAATNAAAIWDAAQLADDNHPYLARKGIKANGARLHNGDLLFPLRIGAEIYSLQFINANGDKRFLTGGKVKGCYFIIGSTEGATALCIAEGFATGATIHEATGYPVAVAFNAGNLQAVAQAMREKFPDLPLTLCVDDDTATSGNPGLTKATEAAGDVGGLLAIPDFGDDRPEEVSDFNDLYQHCGIDAVRTAIANASKPTGSQLITERTPNGDSTHTFWPKPKPIQAPLRPVPSFDPEIMLPEVLRRWVMDEADRMPCPPDFIAAGALVALGSIIGARCAIKSKSRDSWLIVPNLWGGLVAQPSAKKSPAIGAALKPLDRLIAKAIKAHQEDVEVFEADKTVFEAKREAIESNIKAAAKDSKKGNLDSLAKELQGQRQQAPVAPILRRYKSNDTTVEKLGELLRDNPNGLLVMRDELVGLLASWDKEGREGERAFYLEAWNGDASFDTDRIGRGSIFIPNLCVSIFGGIQPDKLIGYLEQAANALANDGMLQRFQLLVYPDHRDWEWRDRSPDKGARDQAFAVFEALADFDPVVWGAAPSDDFAKFPYFRFDDTAQEIFIEWSGDLHLKRLPAEDHPIIAQHLAKYDKLFPALALIFHLVDCATTGRGGPVTAEAALRAAAWCEYLEAHARRCYGLLIDDGLRAAQALAKKVRQGKLSDGFTARDVRRNQWRYLTSDEAVQAALDWLEDEGWLRSEIIGGTGPGTGRRTCRYSINPKLWEAGKTEGDHGELA